MKNKYTFVLILLVMISISFQSNAQSVSLPQATITTSPLGTVENNGSGVAEFNFTESSGAEVPSSAFGEPNVSISVNLQYIELKDFNVNQVSGSLLEYFTTSYNETTNILLFEQSADIPGDWFGSVAFPIDVTQNSSQDQSFNGINANISALDSNTNALGNASVFTYTDDSVLEVAEIIDPLVFQVLPNPTDGEFTIKLEKNSDATVELFDLLGKVIFTKEYNNLDVISMNIDYLASTVYILKVTSEGATNSVKIIKE